MSIMWTILTLGFLALAVCSRGVLVEAEAWTMEDICAGRVSQITRISQVADIGQSSESISDKGCARQASTLKPLFQLVKLDKEHNACSHLAVESVEKFGESTKKHFRHAISPVLKSFGQSFLLQLSGQCKLNILHMLPAIDRQINEDDRKLMEKFTAVYPIQPEDNLDKSDLFAIFDEIKTMVIDAGLRFNVKNINQEIDLGIKALLRSFNKACTRSIWPVYQRMFASAAALENNGFAYNINGPLTLHRKNEFNTNQVLRRWLNSILICMMIKDVEEFQSSIKIEIFDVSKIDSATLPLEELVVNQPSGINQQSELTKDASDEKIDLLNHIYSRVTGSHISRSSRITRSYQEKFWYKTLTLIEQKLGVH